MAYVKPFKVAVNMTCIFMRILFINYKYCCNVYEGVIARKGIRQCVDDQCR